MSTSLPHLSTLKTESSQTNSTLIRLLGAPIRCLEDIGGGRNSKVYKCTCGDGQYIVKHYFHHPLDRRDRLASEFSGLQFLWENGLRCIPRPVIADRTSRIAVYEYVDGDRIPSPEVTEDDIDDAVNFLISLHALRDRARTRTLPPASEACFSVQAIVQSIEERLSRLSTCRQEATLEAFLKEEFLPAVQEITEWCCRHLAIAGLRFDAELPEHEWTLSPSDFGFHNALRRAGSVVFLDFEYFGWDDPAKMTADFLLHPAMTLSHSLKRRFLTQVLSGFHGCHQLAERVELAYPLFGLKWCLILLNEFVPHELQRREFANGQESCRDGVRTRQLTKAKAMLEKVKGEYSRFPYSVERATRTMRSLRLGDDGVTS